MQQGVLPIFALYQSSDEDVSRRIRLIMMLRTSGIRDTRVLSAMEQVPRELFVAEAFHDRAYDDTALPIASGQTISQPTVVASMTQALDVQDRHTVLEIGTGSGYQAAILAYLCRRLYTVERHRDLLRTATARFADLELTNVVTRHADGGKGWKEAAPFDRIMVTAAAKEVPQVLVDQLRPGGVMVIPVGETDDTQELIRITKDKQGAVAQEKLTGVRFVPLVKGIGDA